MYNAISWQVVGNHTTPHAQPFVCAQWECVPNPRHHHGKHASRFLATFLAEQHSAGLLQSEREGG
jgi:hypothetical protein